MQLDRRLGSAAPDWLVPTACHFFDTAMRLGWDATHGGLVYGRPDEQVCDGDKYSGSRPSLAAAAWLAVRTVSPRYWDAYDRLWAYAWRLHRPRARRLVRQLHPTTARSTPEEGQDRLPHHGRLPDVLGALKVQPNKGDSLMRTALGTWIV